MSQTATITHEAPAIELGHLGQNQTQNHGPLAHDSSSTEAQGSGDPPPNAQKEVERWNRPRGNLGRLGFAFLSFIIAGMNDAAVGV